MRTELEVARDAVVPPSVSACSLCRRPVTPCPADCLCLCASCAARGRAAHVEALRTSPSLWARVQLATLEKP